MKTRQYLVRTLTLVAFAATLGLANFDHAGAADNDQSQNATTEIQVCEAMGGHAEVTIDRTAGRLIVIVECKGGAMDGFHCINDAGFTDCGFARFELDETVTVSEPGGIKPLDDGARAPVEAVEVEPDVQELPATPTPEPSPIITVVDPVLADPVVDDGAVTPTPESGEIITDPVRTDPVVTDGRTVTDAPADGGRVIDNIKIKDPSLIAPIGGEIKTAPGR
jgi:hypothetical protein